jgi:hypothetical protein
MPTFRLLPLVRTVLSDPKRKSLPQILGEAVRCGVQEREMPVHYFTRMLYRKGAPNYLNFFGNKHINRIRRSLDSARSAELLENKIIFGQLVKAANIPSPEVYGYTIGDQFVTVDSITKASNDEEWRRILHGLVSRAPQGRVFAKLIDGMGGFGAFALTRETLAGPIHTFTDRFKGKSYLFQAAVEQHPSVAQIYSGSVNTIRLDTLLDDGGQVRLLSALMRFGSGGRVVDNASSGGFFVPIDIETGRLKGNGRKFLEHGGEEFPSHPDTGFTFADFQIPFFSEMLELARVAAAMFPNRLVGWDFAIGPEGPILMEGNHNHHVSMSEMAYGGYRTHPIFERFA